MLASSVRGFISKYVSQYSRGLLILVVIAAMLASTFFPFWAAKLSATHGSGTHMYLLWEEAGSAPSGWSVVSPSDGRFIRGESVANALTTSSGSTHTVTVSGLTRGGSSTNTSNGIGATDVSSTGHSHPAPTQPSEVGSASNGDEPAYRSLKLIRYDAGIPNFIPKNAIAMFDDTGIPPSDWTELTASHNRMIKLDSSVGIGGSDTHYHTLDWSSTTLGAASGTSNRQTFFASGGVSAANGHTHTAPASTTGNNQTSDTCSSTGCLPPYVVPLIAKADKNTSAIPAGLVTMFDGSPGTGWVVRSESGGTFYQQFLRPGTTWNGASQGSTTHSHPNKTVQSGTPSATANGWNGTTGNVAGGAHVHNLTVSFNANDENIPEYVNFVLAEKINFIQQDYRWYVDTDAEDVTDPWSSIDVPQNTPITVVPARNDPPEVGRELRLRIRLKVSGQDLPASSVAFKMQWSVGADGDCNAGTWEDLGPGGSNTWNYASSSVTNGAQLTNSRLTPASSVLQIYQKSSNAGSNPNSAVVNETIEYDFHLVNNAAVSNRGYSFRIVESSNTPLNEYLVCPGLETKPGTEDMMRHGNLFTDGSERGFIWAD